MADMGNSKPESGSNLEYIKGREELGECKKDDCDGTVYTDGWDPVSENPGNVRHLAIQECDTCDWWTEVYHP